jgi:predicted dehydrogenase
LELVLHVTQELLVPETRKLRVGLIGAAAKIAGPCHRHALAAIDAIELVAVCDKNSVALHQVASDLGIAKQYDDYRRLLADAEIDAVDIIAPPFVHHEIAVAAASAGKHVYCEKPMTHSLGEARQMVSAAESAGVKLAVGESYYFHAPHRLAHRLITEGKIGDIVQLRQTKDVWVFTPAEYARLEGRGHDVPWRFNSRLSGGGEFPFFMDHGSHLFASARLLAGDLEIETVSALARPFGYGPEAECRGITAVTWNYAGGVADGVWTQIETPPESGPYIGFRTEVIGTRGTLRVFGEGGGAAPDWPQVPPVTILRDGRSVDYHLDDGPDRSWVANNSYYDEAHIATLSQFATSVLEDSLLEYDGREAMKDLAATLATIRSAAEGHAVQVADMPDEWKAYCAG